MTIFELRGGALNKQDILPPSVHPDGHVYRTIGKQPERREDVPELPAVLLDLWANWDARVATFDRFVGAHRSSNAPEAPSPSRSASGSPKRDDRPIEPGGYLDIARQWSELHEHNFAELLGRHGYEPRGRGRWLAPGSQSGDPGVHLMKDKHHIVSHHGSDVLGGMTADGVLTPHDLFDCWCLLEHNGNRGAAFRAAQRELGLAGPRSTSEMPTMKPVRRRHGKPASGRSGRIEPNPAHVYPGAVALAAAGSLAGPRRHSPARHRRALRGIWCRQVARLARSLLCGCPRRTLA